VIQVVPNRGARSKGTPMVDLVAAFVVIALAAVLLAVARGLERL